MAIISPAADVFIFSFFVILTINIFYKILINQKEAKQARDRIKEINQQVKEEQKKGNTEKVNKLIGELMQENSRIMKMSLKPMLVSLVIVLLALPWIADIYGDKSVMLQDGKGVLEVNDATYDLQKTGSGLEISGVGNVEMPAKGLKFAEGTWNVEMNGDSVKFLRIVAYLPIPLPFVGNDLGWLGWYFLSAILFMLLTRKALKIYV